MLYYSQAVDCTVLTTLGSISNEQTSATKNTEKKVKQLLDYLETKPNARIRFYASGVVLNIHVDVSYFLNQRHTVELQAIFFMGLILSCLG